ncbi:MAG: DUF502 domain-containing protein [Planctomycetota bacterium]
MTRDVEDTQDPSRAEDTETGSVGRQRQRGFGQDFKQFFGRGLAILLPSILTLWILWQLAVFVYNNVGQPINQVVRLAIIEITPRVVPDESLPSWFSVTATELTDAREQGGIAGESIPGLEQMEDAEARQAVRRAKFRTVWNDYWVLEASGLIVAIVLIYFSGLLLGGLIGRRIYSQLESLLARIPGFKQVYPHVKQVTEMVLGERPIAFNRVVLVEYPRRGIYTVGLVTGNGLKSVADAAGSDILTVFIPSTPTPFTGFTITVPVPDVIDLPIAVDEAVRFFLTGGVLVPSSEQRPEGGVIEADDPAEAAARATKALRGPND